MQQQWVIETKSADAAIRPADSGECRQPARRAGAYLRLIRAQRRRQDVLDEDASRLDAAYRR